MLKKILEKAYKKENMQWKVYAFNPEKDNELVYTSKSFDCIADAQVDKVEQLKKHPNYIVEISTTVVEESSQKNEGKMLDDISTKEAADYIKTLKFAMPLNHPMSINILGTKLKEHFGLSEKPHSIAIKALLENMPKEYLEAANIDVKNPGILEVPAGKNVEDLPQSHFEKLVDKKGYAEVIRALTNLEVWNKDKNKKLSVWASGMADKLKKKFRPESAQYKFKVGDRVLYEGDKATIKALRTSGTGSLEKPYYNVEKDKEKGKMTHPAREFELKPLQESAQKNEANPNDEKTLITKKQTIQRLASRLTNDNLLPQLKQFKDYVDDVYNFAVKHFDESVQKNEDKIYALGKYNGTDIENLRKRLTHWGLIYGNPDAPTEKIVDRLVKDFPELAKHKKEIIDKVNAHKKKHYADYDDVAFEILTRTESAQVNESRNYVVTAKVSAPDNMNNRDIEDKVEELLDKAGLTVLDIDAARK